MATVTVNLTGETFEASGALLAYYQGEAATVGGYTIDGLNYPAKLDVPADEAEAFDPADHNVADVQTYLANATPAEQDRVIAAERAGKARVSLVGDKIEQLPDGEVDESLNVEHEHPGYGEPMHGVEAPADGSPAEISNE